MLNYMHVQCTWVDDRCCINAYGNTLHAITICSSNIFVSVIRHHAAYCGIDKSENKRKLSNTRVSENIFGSVHVNVLFLGKQCDEINKNISARSLVNDAHVSVCACN